MSINLKLKEKMNNLLVLDAFVDDDLGLDIELGILAKNMKKEVIGVIDYFFSFLTKKERKESMMKKKTHNMLVLMLDSRFESLKLIVFLLVVSLRWP
jgi:hypothetical protein